MLVREALRLDSRLASSPIDVHVNGSEVWLTGTLVGPGVAAYAEDVVRRVDGVTAIHNELAATHET
jgi:osmotically-inducible protein OsmY